ncbi:hypothetical protein PIB30_062960, partial [Stylosanthes scabra]|nr:hypothetical protein [Stylosanthes scabra]
WMGTHYAVPVFHHGGNFIRYPNGELVYADGEVKRFDDLDLDIDHINMGNLVVMLDDLGYKNHKAMHWYDKNAPELETGINVIDGDQRIRELIDWLRVNEEREFHIYVEHTISKPILAEDVEVGERVRAEAVNLDDSSNNEYIPKPGIHISNQDEIGATQYKRKRKENAETDPSSKKKVAEPKAKGKEKVGEAKRVGKGNSPRKNIHGKKSRGGVGPEESDEDVAGQEDVGAGHGARAKNKFYQPEL